MAHPAGTGLLPIGIGWQRWIAWWWRKWCCCCWSSSWRWWCQGSFWWNWVQVRVTCLFETLMGTSFLSLPVCLSFLITGFFKPVSIGFPVCLKGLVRLKKVICSNLSPLMSQWLSILPLWHNIFTMCQFCIAHLGRQSRPSLDCRQAVLRLPHIIYICTSSPLPGNCLHVISMALCFCQISERWEAYQ